MIFVHRLMCNRLILAFLFILTIVLVKGQSVLSTGDWYKVGVTETNIYKLDYDFLSSLGLDINSIDPRTLKVYGNGGGGMLAQSNAESRPFDLQENSIFAVGQSDGSFDTNDYFLFYGRSPNRIDWTSEGLDYEKNLYSDTTYYFITVGGNDGIRISNQSSEEEQSSIISTYDDAIIHELDTKTKLGSGREWYGEELSTGTGLSLTINYQYENVLSYDSAELHAMAQSEGDCSLTMLVNDTEIG